MFETSGGTTLPFLRRGTTEVRAKKTLLVWDGQTGTTRFGKEDRSKAQTDGR